MKEGEVRIRLVKGVSDKPANGIVWYENSHAVSQVIIEQYCGGGWWPILVEHE